MMGANYLKYFSLLLYFISHVAASEERSLAFVVDTTGSMSGDIESLKKGAGLIIDVMVRLTEPSIGNFILVPFNDPGYGPVMFAKDESDLRKKLNDIKVDGGDDCPEMCLSGLKMALEVVQSNSYIFVLTDAYEKDGHLTADVINLARAKKSQIIILISGKCSNIKSNYRDIVEATSGQIFELESSRDVSEVLEYVNKTMEKNTIELGYLVSPKGFGNKLNVSVDESMTVLSVTISGGHPSLDVINPDNVIVTNTSKVSKTINLTTVIGLNIYEPEPGNWVVVHGSDSKNILKVTGKSDIELDYGFSSFDAINMSETTINPHKGVLNKLLVAIKKGGKLIKDVKNVHFIDTAGKTLLNVPLKNIIAYENVSMYESNEFYPPDVLFNIKLIGVDSKGNKVERLSDTSFQEQNPGIPLVTTQKEIVAKLHEKVYLVCKVDSLIPIFVKWYKGTKSLQENEEFFQGGEVIYEIDDLDKSSTGTYTCVASNEIGFSSSTTKVLIPGITPEDDDPYSISDNLELVIDSM